MTHIREIEKLKRELQYYKKDSAYYLSMWFDLCSLMERILNIEEVCANDYAELIDAFQEGASADELYERYTGRHSDTVGFKEMHKHHKYYLLHSPSFDAMTAFRDRSEAEEALEYGQAACEPGSEEWMNITIREVEYYEG